MEKHEGGGINFIDILLLLLALIVVGIFLFTQVDFFVNLRDSVASFNFAGLGNTYHLILTLLVLFFMTIIAYTSVRMFEIRKREHEHLHHEMEEFKHKEAERAEKAKTINAFRNPRWNDVLAHIASENKNDWKLAIIEADSMLEDLLGELGFQGENIGERLKNATQETFKDLTKAWEVHTIRNRIAHEGLAFEISAHEAKRIIAMYEQIFVSFGFI